MKNISNIKIENNHIICRINNTKLCWANVTGCLFNQLVYCMAIFTNKTSEDIYSTVIYYIMPIPCNNMVRPYQWILRYPVVACGILRKSD